MTEQMNHKKPVFLVGVDEAGRGPLAGPVAVGVVAVPEDFDWDLIPGVGDSKQVSAKNRALVFRRAEELQTANLIQYAVTLIDTDIIDRLGITHAVNEGIEHGLKKLSIDPQHATIKLDGLLKAPAEYQNQETIIHGDAKEKVIGLASILAKETRDANMVTLAKAYPLYQFEIHKGYGTKRHRALIAQHGLSPVHRVSFCTKIHVNL